MTLSTRSVVEFRLRYTWYYTQRTSYNDVNGVTDQGHLTGKLMDKFQNLYGIAQNEQNVDYTAVHQLYSKNYFSC